MLTLKKDNFASELREIMAMYCRNDMGFINTLREQYSDFKINLAVYVLIAKGLSEQANLLNSL